ncbi:MAG: protease Do [Candidatus Woesebacteria bacterium GW2011_GWA1_39_8]|uniref:Protease Do n=1 Tax=Candidatus Woesebacteria bacterium GW2011_GWA1_39_8 TaxID=1618552 RepID=A0A0G0PPZ9_9BACT|nr:MAG: protease Do [Candidatus Woesebacteria bacterium GW2011_GWA1_39_8]
MKRASLRWFLLGLAVGMVFLATATGGAIADRLYGFKPLDKYFPAKSLSQVTNKVLNEQSVTIDVVKKTMPSVVTVQMQIPQRRVLQFNPFGGFSQSLQGGEPQDIGTGFVISKDGLIVTNKHVVSDSTATYKVITSDGKVYDAKEISRDPANDIAIIKIDSSDLTPVSMGESSNLQVGQYVVAFGTALGQFRGTVTTGVISGLGRGIQAGDYYQGYVEELDDVIQTDAAINPGNSGGPLVDSNGDVIGINVAVAQGAQNIGFAIPIDIVKNALIQFNQNGKFEARPFLGVEYQMISRQAAILNDPDLIAQKKAGQQISLEVWREGESLQLSATLSEFSE